MLNGIDIKARIKNPVFWVSLCCFIFNVALQNTTNNMTWIEFIHNFLTAVDKPMVCLTFVGTVVGIFINPVTPGLKDV